MIEQILKKVDELYEAMGNPPLVSFARAEIKHTISSILTEEQRTDLLAMIEFLEDREKSAAMILASVMHDIYGLANQGEFFVPYSHGYVKRLKSKLLNIKKNG